MLAGFCVYMISKYRCKVDTVCKPRPVYHVLDRAGWIMEKEGYERPVSAEGGVIRWPAKPKID